MKNASIVERRDVRRIAGGEHGRPPRWRRRRSPDAGSGEAVTATPGQDVKMMLLPKFLGILPFDQANQGAQEAAAELQNPTAFDFVGPTAENSVAGQIEFVTNAPAGGYDVVMLSNNSGDQIVPAAEAAQEAGTKVVTWDSPIPTGEGESLFVAQVDFDETGQVMADMALLDPRRGRRPVRDPLRVAGRRQPERLDRGDGDGARGSEVRQPRAAGDRLRRRPVREELRAGAGADLQVPGHGADHGPDLGRHRRRGQGACRTKGSARRSRSPVWACRRRCSSTPRTAARRSSRSGASSTSAT